MMRLNGTRVRPYDTLYYQPTAGSEVEMVVQAVGVEGLRVRQENGSRVTLTVNALREAASEGRLRVAPAAGRVGEGEVER